MSRPADPPIAWRWARFIARDQEARWTEELAASGESNWMIVEKPGRVRLVVEAYFGTKQAALAFAKHRAGRIERFKEKPPALSQPVRVNAALEIVHDEKAPRSKGRLIIPYGVAFGSGEHATTLMLLRALARKKDLAGLAVLDLGTGSGVLALSTRLLGVSRLTATDFDPAAIRTARRNELLNFSTRRVHWEVADARRLRARPRFGLIVANLYSGILMEAAPRLAKALELKGELWLSGVLRSQQDEVSTAFRNAGLRLLKTTTRGKWLMQRWTKSPPH